MERLYNARQAGEYLGFSSPRQYVHSLLGRGKFPDPKVEVNESERSTKRFWTQKQLDQYKEDKEKGVDVVENEKKKGD